MFKSYTSFQDGKFNSRYHWKMGDIGRRAEWRANHATRVTRSWEMNEMNGQFPLEMLQNHEVSNTYREMALASNARSDQIWRIWNSRDLHLRFLVAGLILLYGIIWCIYIYTYVPSLHSREQFRLQFPELWILLAQVADKTIQHNAKHRFLIPEVRKLNSQKQPSMEIYGLAPWSPPFLLWTLTPRAPRWSMIIFKLILISFFGIIESDKVIELSDEQLCVDLVDLAFIPSLISGSFLKMNRTDKKKSGVTPVISSSIPVCSHFPRYQPVRCAILLHQGFITWWCWKCLVRCERWHQQVE